MEEKIGKKFGKLSIVSFSRETKNGLIYNCLCDCGRKTTIECNLKKLEKGKVKDCGCSKRNIDLTGKTFGKLKVLSRNYEKQNDRNVVWDCICECGNSRVVMTHQLTSGKVTHCGCDDAVYRNDFTESRVHSIWNSMKTRTKYNENYTNKNIKVCNEWLGKFGFINFYNWSMENGYEENLTIDRIDNNKGYSPDNCRYISSLGQAYNKTNTIYVEYNGKKYNFLELEKIINKPRKFIYYKWKKGYSIEEIKKMDFVEKEKIKYNINYQEIYNRGYIPICDIKKRYNITEKRMKNFFIKNQIEKKKIKGKNCFKKEFLPMIEKYFNIKINY